MAEQRKRESRFPHRLQGTFVSEDTYVEIKEACTRHDKSTAEVIRGGLAKGMGAYRTRRGESHEENQDPDDKDLFETIEEAATELGMKESEIVHGALESGGLEEFLFMERGRRFHERNAGGRALSDDILRRLLLNEDSLYNEEALKRRLDTPETVRELERKLGGNILDPSAFCFCCGQYVRKDERGSFRDKRLEFRAGVEEKR